MHKGLISVELAKKRNVLLPNELISYSWWVPVMVHDTHNSRRSCWKEPKNPTPPHHGPSGLAGPFTLCLVRYDLLGTVKVKVWILAIVPLT